ncbi:spermatogenesis-associated protein 24 [Trachemys scripta elegans]|uniref:spermatogenesis-associated protein 24 n=1 Tax=Trachemys scripta elegans TaxID=31138 RepID=UPI0015522A65|nr:spermatogenesis-associated protein 24 [Trachemys scripta elegans]
MAAGPGEPEWGRRPGTEALAFRQLRDLVATQEALIERLRLRIAIQEENFVHKEDYEAVLKKLEKEEEEHSKTKTLLAKEAEKLQFALGEIEVLSKQLEREKQVFEKALSNVKSKALRESTKKDKLISKCNEIESHIMKQEDLLNDKENEIKELQQFITKQKQTLKTQVSDLKIQKQQESYIAQVLEKKQKKGLK